MVNKKVVAAATAAAAATAVVVTARTRQRLSGPRVTMRSVTVDRPASVVYGFWRDLPGLARALDREATVEVVDDRVSRWAVRGGRLTVEITGEEPDRMLSWRVDDGIVPHTGRMDLIEAPGGRGTEMHVSLKYDLPGGPITGDEPDSVLRTLLRRIKQLLECGIVTTTDGQPTGRGPLQERITRVVQHRLVTGGRP
ncbi:SRPBCC family protein [Allorhizocola rhizosphaerae]|uniref:SRPBCC family protein n=1 Tax=Allorhizocola rhizosphaerae TaxID=1872709 RepID=UPI000E3D6AF0|nr:SRPBCC family protein [Allorhizocola rhizosphaerae]